MTADQLFDLMFWVPLLAAGIRIATPLLFAGLGEAVAERSGLLNVGAEGMMALGAYTGFAAAVWADDAWTGLLAGALVGMAAGLLFGEGQQDGRGRDRRQLQLLEHHLAG